MRSRRVSTLFCVWIVLVSALVGCAHIVARPGASEQGRASWYGPGFHGRKTANGERFNMYALTAAHKTLPMNSIVRVRDVETGNAVNVRINDRGPFARGRIIDLSYQAARQLGMLARGEGKVELEVLSVP